MARDKEAPTGRKESRAGMQFGPNWKYGQDCIEVTYMQFSERFLREVAKAEDDGAVPIVPAIPPQPDAPIPERWRYLWDRCEPGLLHDIGGSIVRKVIEDCGRAEAALTQVREALSNSADQTLNDASKCYCLEERLAKGYEYGEVGGEHQPWCDNARAALAATKE